MIITYHGVSCFKVQAGETVLAFDPPSKKSGLKYPRFHADIILQSHDHDRHNGKENLMSKEKESFFVDTPGEYEIKGIYIQGLKSFHDAEGGEKYGSNTIYVVRLENVNLCFLGDFGEKELRPELKEEIGKADVLFVPIGGESVLEPEAARNIVNQIEPSIVVPMHYLVGGKAGKKEDNLKMFIAEFGQKDIVPVEKLNLRKKDIVEDGTRIVVFSSLL